MSDKEMSDSHLDDFLPKKPEKSRTEKKDELQQKLSKLERIQKEKLDRIKSEGRKWGIILGLQLLSLGVHAISIWILWNWFGAPVFGYHLGFANAWGLSFLVSVITGDGSIAKAILMKEPNDKLKRRNLAKQTAIMQIVGFTGLLAIGGILKLFM